MKLSYGFSFEDFRALQPRFAVRAGQNIGSTFTMAMCAIIACGLLFGFFKGYAAPAAVLLFFLCIGIGMLAYWFDRYSIRRKQKQYENAIATAYQRVHCRDERGFEANEEGFTVSCKCGALTRPWSELKHFTEGDRMFGLGTQAGMQVVPKSAFPTEAARTEFRALVNEKLNSGRPLTARHFDVLCTPQERRGATLLHIRKGGGWRPLAKSLGAAACVIALGIVLYRTQASPGLLTVFALLVMVSILRAVQRRKKPFFGVVRIHFSPEGLYLEDQRTQARSSWESFIGYLEDDQLLLLYYNARLYRVIPKRALAGPGATFEELVKQKLPPYDYRAPAPVGTAAS